MLQIDSNVAGIVITALMFLLVGAIVGSVVFAGHRAREMRYQTIRLALEKGQPLPPELLRDAERHGRLRHGRNDLQRGVIMLFLGMGLSGFLYLSHRRIWGAGFILIALGFGYLVSHLVGGGGGRESPPAP